MLQPMTLRLISAAVLCIASISTLAQNAPVDFEVGGHGANWSWRVFENDDDPPLVVVQNPDITGINPSPNVALFNARVGGAPFAGVETTHGIDIGTWTITNANSTIRIMVHKDVISDVGIKLVRNDNWSLGEIKKANTVINEWEQITFDFSAHIGNTYDQIVIFPDFGGRSSDRKIYIDNIYGAQYVAPPPAPDSATMVLPNFFSPNSDGVNDLFKPRMQHADWATWTVFNRWGTQVFTTNDIDESWNGRVNGNAAAPGVYFIVAKCGSNEVGNTVELQGAIHLLD